MRRLFRSKSARRLSAASLATLLVLAATASAFFTSTGIGSATSLVGALSAPTIVSATSGAGTVNLSWSTVTPPTGSDPVTYYIARNGGAPAGNCPTSTSSSSVTSCADSGLSKGTYTYTVTAVWHSWTATSVSKSTTLSSGAVSQLVFTTQPDGSATGGVAFPQQPVVTAEDAAGNTVTSYAGTVSLAIKTGTGASGATLSGCTGSLSGGVATFAGCKIDKAGTGYQLAASDGTFNGNSAPFAVTAGPAVQLLFTTQPDGSATGGVAFPQQPIVTAVDAGGNPSTGYSGTVALSIKTGTGASGATLSGCTGSLSGGVTTFSGCTIDKAGPNYQLTASDGSLNITSAAFNVSAGPATHLVFTIQPDGSATGGSTFPQQPVVTAEDAGGNTATSYGGTVSLSIKTGTGAMGAALSGCSGSLSAGVSTFTGCKIDKAGTGYVLTAGDGTRSVDSAVFTISVGSVSQLVYTTQPDGSATGGVAFPQQPVVTAEDAGGNTVTTYSGTVSLSIKSGTGATGASLSGCSSTLSGGVTTFSGCKIDKSGTGYQLTASDATRSVDSAAFTISAGPATQLVFTTQPDGSATGGVAFPTQPVVTARDAGGNTATSDAGTVSLSIKSGTGATGATLSACSGSLSAGVTTFSGCKIDKAGTGYVLTGGDGTRSVDSAAFTVSVGPAAQLVFSTQPDGSPTAGQAFPQQPVVTAEDAGGNTATSFAGPVALSITSGTGTTGATLSGCSGSLSAGVTTFTGCKIDKGGTGYQLHASATGVAAVDSSAFTVANSVSVSMIGQGAAKSASTGNVTTTAGATDVIAIYCWGGSACGSTGSVPTITGPFSSVSTQSIQSIMFSGSTKSCVEVVQATGNGQTGPVTVSFSGGGADSVGFVDVLQLSAGATVKAVGLNPATQTSSSSAVAVLNSPGTAELAFVGLDGNSGNDTITPPAGLTPVIPLSGFTNPQSSSSIGNAGGDLGIYFGLTAQSSATFTLSPASVDWGTVALGVG